MSYKLIKGQFHIFYSDLPRSGPEADGDTLKFKPDHPGQVSGLQSPGGARADFNGRGMVNLRLEGIDALETHFQHAHQNLRWAETARNALLQAAGFGQVAFWEDLPQKVKTVENHPAPGYILARGLDPFGRVIAFVFPGQIDLVDGAQVFMDMAMLEQSINAMLVRQGLVYPAFYSTLPADLRERLAQMTREARNDRMGLWPEAVATVERSATVTGPAALQDLVVWPKLFRRLVGYLGTGFTALDGFDAWLRADPVNRDDFVLLPNREVGNMHDLIEIEGNTLSMRYRTEEIVILPDGTLPPVVVAPPVTALASVVRIVAALVNPAGPEPGRETVTLLNAGPDPIDFSSGWALVDRANTRQMLTGVLGAGEAVRIALRSIHLNNDGDTITLLDDQARQVDQVSYSGREAKKKGWSVVFFCL
jgi:endonuclease YncB( thermonuclease family)